MNGLLRQSDEELLVVLLDIPNRWRVISGFQSAPASTLRQALRKAHEFSVQGSFLGTIVKQPNDEMIVDADQIYRLWEYIGIVKSSQALAAKISGISSYTA